MSSRDRWRHRQSDARAWGSSGFTARRIMPRAAGPRVAVRRAAPPAGRRGRAASRGRSGVSAVLAARRHGVVQREHVGVEVGLVGETGKGRPAAASPTRLSIMQPRSTRRPSRRAAAIIASAGEIPPHFISLTLTPATAPERDHVVRALRVLVGVDRDRRVARERREQVGPSRRQRLLELLDPEIDQQGEQRARRPPGSSRRWRRPAGAPAGPRPRPLAPPRGRIRGRARA